ncbi:MAG: hypothetical protein ACTS41_01870 [Candidatus Hodgkinia cicadicola]
MRLSLRTPLVLPQMKKFNRLDPNAITSRSPRPNVCARKVTSSRPNAVEPLAMTKMAGAFIANDPLRAQSQPLCLRPRPFQPSRLASASKVPKLNTFVQTFATSQTSLPPLNNVRPSHKVLQHPADVSTRAKVRSTSSLPPC